MQSKFPSVYQDSRFFSTQGSKKFFLKGTLRPESGSIRKSANQTTANGFYTTKNQESYKGYEISVEVPLQHSFDRAYQNKLIQFIEKFYCNGQLKLSLSLPHTLSDDDKKQFQKEFEDLQFQMQQVDFDKSTYLFYQKIYEFQGQDEFNISPTLEMLIFDNFIFQEISSKATKLGYSFICNYQNSQCFILTSNLTFKDPKESLLFFVDNIYRELNKYSIIEIETSTSQETLMKYDLIIQLKQKIDQYINIDIQPVLINLKRLFKDPNKQLDDKIIQKINNQLQYDKLYLIFEKNEADIANINSELKKFIMNKQNIYYKEDKFTITFEEVPERFYQQIDIMKQNFQDVSIRVSDPKQISKQTLQIQACCETWQMPLYKQNQFTKNINMIQNHLNQICNPFLKIQLTDQQQKTIWNDYLRAQYQQKELDNVIEYENLNQEYNIKIKTEYQNHNQIYEQIKQDLNELKLYDLTLNSNSQVLQILCNCNNGQQEFEKILNKFQKQDWKKIKCIKLLGLNSQTVRFRIISPNNTQLQDIEADIKNKFLNDLTVYNCKVLLNQAYNSLNLKYPQLINDQDILELEQKDPDSKKQYSILIGKKSQIQKIKPNIDDLVKQIQNNKTKIQFILENPQIAERIIIKLEALKLQFFETFYENNKMTVEFLKQNFDEVVSNLKEFEKGFKIDKHYLEDIEWPIFQEIDINSIEKNYKAYIDIQYLNLLDPNLLEGSTLKIDNRSVKLIQGNISLIKCQAIVLESIKCLDFTNQIIQNEILRNFKLLANYNTELLDKWKIIYNEGRFNKDIKHIQLSNSITFKHLFQIYPRFYLQTESLKTNLKHIKGLIKEVFIYAKEFNLQEIAFPLIGVGMFGYSQISIRQILIQEIISQLSMQDCTINQVFLIVDNKIHFQQMDQYFGSLASQPNPDKISHNFYNPHSQLITQYQYEIGGDLINIEDPELHEQVSVFCKSLNQGENIKSVIIPSSHSKHPGTHLVNMNTGKIIEITTQKVMEIRCIELFKQRFYFIDKKQVKQSLNQYLLIKHELCQQQDFFINDSETQLTVENSQPHLQTVGQNDKKIIKTSEIQINSVNKILIPLNLEKNQQQNNVDQLIVQIKILHENKEKKCNIMKILEQQYKGIQQRQAQL